MAEDIDMQRLEKAVDALGEHFDTVHIYCTRHESGEEGGTISVNRGSGNWFARVGQIREWLTKQDERTRCEIRKESEDEE